mgnify:CR=1 FL=1
MAHDARILQEGVAAFEDVVVGAADADAVHAHDRFAGHGRGRLRDVDARRPQLEFGHDRTLRQVRDETRAYA